MEDKKHLENNSAPPDLAVEQAIPGMVGQKTDLEETMLLEIFPNETWLQIFAYIGKPKDMANLGKSSLPFGKLLKLLKTKVLFPAVIKVIVTKLSVAGKEIQRDLLNCRLVCHYWEIGVNAVFNSFSANGNLVQPNHPLASGRPFKENTNHFLTPEHAVKFLQHFDEAYACKNRNPFLGQRVGIRLNNQRDEISFAQPLLEILRNYGHHILNFVAGGIRPSSHQPNDEIFCYEQLRDMLHLMPNLKELTIESYTGISKEGRQALQLSMQSNAFPELTSLQRLQVVDMPGSVFDALLRCYSHVPILDITDTTFAYTNKLLYSHRMSNLTQLGLDFRNTESLAQLETANTTWSLTNLDLRVGFEFSVAKWQSLFQILENRWGSTLTKLRINTGHGSNNMNDGRSMKVLPNLKLPKLKMLSFNTTHFVSMDFILPLSKSLEHLRVWYFRREAQETDFIQKEKAVKFYTFCRNLRESNIWLLFPKLKEVNYYDWDVGYYRVFKPRLPDSENGAVNNFIVQHVKDVWT